MTVITGKLALSTRGNTDIQDITPALTRLVGASSIDNGLLTVFCPSSTSGITTLEFEPGACADLKQFFEQLIPAGHAYAHNATWGDGNGHSHQRAALLGASLTIPFVEKTLTLGTWQQVVYVDFDIRARQRELVVQLTGE